jgi:hypothetical protein
MFPYRKFYVLKDERAILFYRGAFKRVLNAGEHQLFDPFRRYTVEYVRLVKVVGGAAQEQAPSNKIRARRGKAFALRPLDLARFRA